MDITFDPGLEKVTVNILNYIFQKHRLYPITNLNTFIHTVDLELMEQNLSMFHSIITRALLSGPSPLSSAGQDKHKSRETSKYIHVYTTGCSSLNLDI